ncbi:MAG: DUF977 family protein [Candidatus Paceibacterota bacterium]
MELIILIFALVFALGIGLLVLLLMLPKSRDKVIGICQSALESTSQKEERKERIISLLEERQEITNTDVRETLGVSARSAVRYLDELEKEGRVEQVGATGHAVRYRLR